MFSIHGLWIGLGQERARARRKVNYYIYTLGMGASNGLHARNTKTAAREKCEWEGQGKTEEEIGRAHV